MNSPPTTATESEDQWSAADFLRIMYLIFGLLGLLGNGLALFVFIRVRSWRTITNLFLGDQSLIDMVSSVFLLISKYRNEETDFAELGRARGLVVCLFWTSDFIYWSLLVCSTTNLVIITLERYIAVFKPIVYRRRVNWRTASTVTVSVWVFGFIFEIFWPAVHRLEGGECFPDWRSPSIQAVVGVVVFVGELIIPTIVMVWVYVSIVRKLRAKVGTETDGGRNQPETRDGPPGISRISGFHNNEGDLGEPRMPIPRKSHNHGVENGMQRKVRSNVIKTLFLVSFVYVLCWTPNQVIFLMYNLGVYDLDFNGVIFTFSVSLAFCNSWINPFIYAFKYRKFQEGLRIVLCLQSSGGASAPTTGTNVGIATA